MLADSQLLIVHEDSKLQQSGGVLGQGRTAAGGRAGDRRES